MWWWMLGGPLNWRHHQQQNYHIGQWNFHLRAVKKLSGPHGFAMIFSPTEISHIFMAEIGWAAHPIFLHFDWFSVNHVTGSQNRVGHSIFLLLLNGNFTALYGNFIVDDDVSLVAHLTFIITMMWCFNNVFHLKTSKLDWNVMYISVIIWMLERSKIWMFCVAFIWEVF